MNRFVCRKNRSSITIEAAFVSVQPRLARNVFCDDLVDCHLVGMGNMESANATAALHKSYDGALVGGARPAALGLVSEFEPRERTPGFATGPW